MIKVSVIAATVFLLSLWFCVGSSSEMLQNTNGTSRHTFQKPHPNVGLPNSNGGNETGPNHECVNPNRKSQPSNGTDSGDAHEIARCSENKNGDETNDRGSDDTMKNNRNSDDKENDNSNDNDSDDNNDNNPNSKNKRDGDSDDDDSDEAGDNDDDDNDDDDDKNPKNRKNHHANGQASNP